MVDPKSLAGVLLREHDSIAQALRYAERKAEMLGATGSALALEYAEAAASLKRAQTQ